MSQATNFLSVAQHFKLKKTPFHLRLCKCFIIQRTLQKTIPVDSTVHVKTVRSQRKEIQPAKIRKLPLNFLVVKPSFSNWPHKMYTILLSFSTISRKDPLQKPQFRAEYLAYLTNQGARILFNSSSRRFRLSCKNTVKAFRMARKEQMMIQRN